MKEILKLGAYLFVVCSIAGLALSGTNHFTSKRIVKQRAAAEKSALVEVLPSARKFKQENDYNVGLDEKNNPVGYVLGVTANGYSGKIGAIVGIDTQLRITGMKILTQTETPGLGANIAKESFLGQFKGRSSDQVLLKKDGGGIDAITAATISSRAITKAAKERIHEFEKHFK